MLFFFFFSFVLLSLYFFCLLRYDLHPYTSSFLGVHFDFFKQVYVVVSASP